MTFRTENHTYTLIDAGDGAFFISGHPGYCPTPIKVRLRGPVMLGKCVNFIPIERHEKAHGILTTPVQEIFN